MKVLLKGDSVVERAYAEYQKFCQNDEMRELDNARQRTIHDYVSDACAQYAKGLAKGEAKGKAKGFAKGKAEGEIKGQIKAILTMLKAHLKEPIPQHIVNALQKRTDPTALESLLVKAATCQSFEDFENEL